MMQDLVTQGPVVVGFEVYDDFFNYSGGIYRHTGMSRTNKFITVYVLQYYYLLYEAIMLC